MDISYDGARVDYSSANAYSLEGNSPGGEGPPQAIDQNVNTKFLDFNKKSLYVDFGKATTINGYRFATANDDDVRDPISWVFYGSNDGASWATLDSRVLFPTTTSRYTYLPYLKLLRVRDRRYI